MLTGAKWFLHSNVFESNRAFPQSAQWRHVSVGPEPILRPLRIMFAYNMEEGMTLERARSWLLKNDSNSDFEGVLDMIIVVGDKNECGGMLLRSKTSYGIESGNKVNGICLVNNPSLALFCFTTIMTTHLKVCVSSHTNFIKYLPPSNKTS